MASYYVYSAAAGSANGSSWANAYTSLTTAFSGHTAGDVYYVAHDHAESTGGAVTLTSGGTVNNPVKVICVNRAGSVPPVSADRRATAQVATTVNNNISITGFTHYDGIIFVVGNSTGSPSLVVPSVASQSLRFDNCSLRIGSTGSGRLQIGSTGVGGDHVELNNTTVSFAAVGQGIDLAGVLKWQDTASALLGTIPTTLFQPITARGGTLECIGVDLSAAGSGKTLIGSNPANVASARFVDCKLDAAVTKVASLSNNAVKADFTRSGASGVNYQVASHRYNGALTEETTIVRTGGASDGTTALAWKIVTNASALFSMPFECPPIVIWCDTTGSAVTATIEGIGAALPTDEEVWLEVEYLGSASSPIASFVNDGKADLLATAANQTSSSETWGGSTTAFKLAVTFTPQQKGWLYGRVKIAKASSTLYIDPLITLT